MSNKNNTINYIELPLLKIAETKQFYAAAFGWQFTDWGPKYLSFSGAGIDGGFNGEGDAGVSAPGVLVVLYADDLMEKYQAVESAGGKISKPVYGFPGGQRFHFLDPNGNELAVWSE
jgi:hypothetical protein